jgi:hypothetical protein
MIVNDPEILAEVAEVFACYENALAKNDIATLDGLFRDAPETVRYGVGENLYGAAEIAAFRQNRIGGSPPREVLRPAIATYGRDFATTNIEFRRIGGDVTGRQSQCWIRTEEGWRIVSAHVSLMGKKEG